MAVLRPLAVGTIPAGPLGVPHRWTFDTFEDMLRQWGGAIIATPRVYAGNNCLFIAVSALLRRSGANLGGPAPEDLLRYSLRLRRTTGAHVLDYPLSATPPRPTGRVRVAPSVDDRATASAIANSLQSGQMLGPRVVPVISSVLGLSFEVLVIDADSPVIPPHNAYLVSSDQGPLFVPVFAGTLVLFDGHWYPVAAPI